MIRAITFEQARHFVPEHMQDLSPNPTPTSGSRFEDVDVRIETRNPRKWVADWINSKWGAPEHPTQRTWKRHRKARFRPHCI